MKASRRFANDLVEKTTALILLMSIWQLRITRQRDSDLLGRQSKGLERFRQEFLVKYVRTLVDLSHGGSPCFVSAAEEITPRPMSGSKSHL